MKTLKNAKINEVSGPAVSEFKKEEPQEEGIIKRLARKGKIAAISLAAMAAVLTTSINCSESEAPPPIVDIANGDLKDVKSKDVKDTGDVESKDVGDVENDAYDRQDAVGDNGQDAADDADNDDVQDVNGDGNTQDINYEDVENDAVQDINDDADGSGDTYVCEPNWESKEGSRDEIRNVVPITGNPYDVVYTLYYEREEDGCGNSRNERFKRIEIAPKTPISDLCPSEMPIILCTGPEDCLVLEVNKRLEDYEFVRYGMLGFKGNAISGLITALDKTPVYEGCDLLRAKSYYVTVDGEERKIYCILGRSNGASISFDGAGYDIDIGYGAGCSSSGSRKWCLELQSYESNNDRLKIKYSVGISYDGLYIFPEGKNVCFSTYTNPDPTKGTCDTITMDNYAFYVKKIELDENGAFVRIIIDVVAP